MKNTTLLWISMTLFTILVWKSFDKLLYIYDYLMTRYSSHECHPSLYLTPTIVMRWFVKCSVWPTAKTQSVSRINKNIAICKKNNRSGVVRGRLKIHYCMKAAGQVVHLTDHGSQILHVTAGPADPVSWGRDESLKAWTSHAIDSRSCMTGHTGTKYSLFTVRKHRLRFSLSEPTIAERHGVLIALIIWIFMS